MTTLGDKPLSYTTGVDLHSVGHGRIQGVWENVKDPRYGAVGDGTTDDTAAITAASAALSAGGTLVLPVGDFVYSSASPLAIGNYLNVRGAGMGKSRIILSGSAGLSFNGAFVHMEDLSIVGGSSADLCTVTTLNQSRFVRCQFVQNSTTKRIVYGSGATVVGTEWHDCEFEVVPTLSVSPVSLTGDGNINQNVFDGCWVYMNGMTAAPFFFIDNTNAGGYNYDNVFRNITMEDPRGGIASVLSGMGTVFDHVDTYDLSGATTGDLFRVNKHAGGLKSKYTQFNQCNRRGGSLGGGFYDIDLVAGGADTTEIRRSNTSSSGYAINAGSNGGLSLIGIDENVTVSNAPAGLYGVIQLRNDGLVIASGGATTMTKAGTPVDGDWTTAPPVGTIVVDTTANKIWVRTGAATWKGVVVA